MLAQNKTKKTKTILLWHVKKIVKYIPVVFVNLLFTLIIVPFAGSGPVWFLYEQAVTKACRTYWWTHLLMVNNIVPTHLTFDCKCLPWTWFVSVYV